MWFLGVGMAFFFPPAWRSSPCLGAAGDGVWLCPLLGHCQLRASRSPQAPLPQPGLYPHAGLVVPRNVLQYWPGRQKGISRIQSSAQKACPWLNPSSATSLCCQSQCCSPSCLAQLTQALLPAHFLVTENCAITPAFKTRKTGWDISPGSS